MQYPIKEILKQFDREIVAIAIFSFIANVLMLTPTIYLLQVFDRVMISQSGLTLIAVSMISLFLFGVMGFSEWCRSRLLVRTGLRFDELLNSKVFHASFKASLDRGLSSPGQGLGDLTNLRQFLTGSNIFAFFDAPWAPVYIAVSWLLHPVLGMISVGFLVILVFFAVISQWITYGEHQVHIDASNKAATFLQTKIRNAEVICSMGMTDDLYHKWQLLYNDQRKIAATIQDHSQRSQSLIKFLQYSQQSLVLGAGAVLVIDGELTIGAMIAASVLATRALQPIQSLVASWRTVMVAKISYQRLNRLLLDYPENAGLVLPKVIEGRLSCENLTALAADKNKEILTNINLTIEPGVAVAVIGPSGSGKSTLARCLLGIWPLVEGDVKLDTIAIKSLDREVLGPLIGYLPQEVELFEGSIADNIARFGKLDSTKIIEAAEITGIHEIILRFPKGYDSPIGAAGSLLSGGQLQRIAFARAIYGDPKILVLDEPNANLDDLGEAALLKAIIDLKKRGVTIIFISHRHAVLNAADQILILENGKIKSFGSRDQILEEMQRAR